MIKFLTLCLSLFLLACATESYAKDYTNHLKKKAEVQAINSKIKEIPIYKEKLEGNYHILGPVRGQDLFTTKRSAIMAQMRLQAYKMGANAIMEFHCDPMLKKALYQCEGFGVYIPE